MYNMSLNLVTISQNKAQVRRVLPERHVYIPTECIRILLIEYNIQMKKLTLVNDKAPF